MSIDQSAVTTNHSFTTAEFLGTDSGIQSAVNASISMQEEDFYSFTLTEKKKITLTTVGSANGDTQLYLYNAAYEKIALDDDGGEDNYSQLIATLDAGNYYAKVKAYGTSTIPEYSLNVTIGNPEESSLIVTTAEDVVDAYDGVVSLREAIAYAKELGGEQTITFSIDGSDSFECGTDFIIPQNITVNGINLKTGNKMQRSGNGTLKCYEDSTITDIIHYSPITNRHGSDMYLYNSSLKRIVTGNYADIYLFSCSAEDMELQKQGLMLAYNSEIHNIKIKYQGVLAYSLQNTFTGDITIGGAVSAKVGNYNWESTVSVPSFSGADSQVSSDACITFDLSAWTAGQVMTHFANDTEDNAHGTYGTSCTHSMLIDNMKVFTGAGSYTVSVKDDQTLGTYQLAGNAADFNTAMSLTVGDSTYENVLNIGRKYTANDRDYTLALNNDNVLTLTIAENLYGTAPSDIDGNGVSDVMFQFTGGDYQIGFWMNGTNTWQGQGIAQDADFKLIGAYDMDASGTADALMIGSTSVFGHQGTFVGYYLDGTSSQWTTIGFLDNPGNIQWENAVGNLTGNDNCNSIVWQAPELGALGVWTDGTANWVSLGSGYDSNWTMLGCGDFDGNGKDEVLFTNAGNLYTTDIDQNFTSLGGWGTDWEVKTIGDFAGDGQDDIILQNGNMLVKFNNGKADDWASIGAMDASDWFIVGAGDYNGDQQDDLLVRQYSTGMLGYYSAGDMSQWNELGRGVDMNWNVIA